MNLRTLAYAVVTLAVAFSIYRAEVAINLARTVDHAGDIRACENENTIRRESNKRDAALEKTARLHVEALETISEGADPKTARKLRMLARNADQIVVDFAPARLTDCQKAFPKP